MIANYAKALINQNAIHWNTGGNVGSINDIENSTTVTTTPEVFERVSSRVLPLNLSDSLVSALSPGDIRGTNSLQNAGNLSRRCGCFYCSLQTANARGQQSATTNTTTGLTDNAYLDGILWGGNKWPTITPTTTITYSFMSDPALDDEFYNDSTVGYSWFEYEIEQMKLGLETWSNVANIEFVRTNDNSTEADMKFFLLGNSETGYLGSFSPPGTFGEGIGYFNWAGSGWDEDGPGGGLAQGGYGFVTIIHELGHGLGLAHPHDTGGGSNVFPGVTAPFGDTGAFGLNQGVYTTMSYNDGLDTDDNAGLIDYSYQGTPMAFDIAAVQHLYGANMSYKIGDDTYLLPTTNESGTFYSSIWDAGGIDTISAETATADATINLNDASLTGPNAGGYISTVDGIFGGFTIANTVVIENAIGGKGADLITGNESGNVLDGAAGSDTLIGGNGNDSLYGDEGFDYLDGGLGNDLLSGGLHEDVLYGQEGDDTLYGDEGDDYLDGGLDNDILYGGTGNDEMHGHAGDDRLHGGADDDHLAGWIGNDVLYGDDGADYLDGGPGDDILNGGLHEDGLYGQEGDDILNGDDGHDYLYGGLGNDQLYGGNGNDELHGHGGNDTLIGGAGNDTIHGWDDNDIIFGRKGDDVLVGGDGNDVISGNEGNDHIEGGAGRDRLYGNDGDDVLLGGDGDDIFYVSEGADHMDGGADYDVIVLYGLTYGVDADLSQQTLSKTDGTAMLTTIKGIERATGTQFADRLVSHQDGSSLWGREGNDILEGSAKSDSLRGNEGNDILKGRDGNDFLIGNEGNDTLEGGAGDDILSGHAGDNILLGGDGNDGLYIEDGVNYVDGGAGEDYLSLKDLAFGAQVNLAQQTLADANGNALPSTIHSIEHARGSQFDDLLIGDAGNNRLWANAGNDTIEGGAGNDHLRGHAGDDDLFGGVGNDGLRGNLGNDTLNGGAGNDSLFGDDGDDILAGGVGNDRLEGGQGSDIFVLGTGLGRESIIDFELGTDRIGLEATLTFGQLSLTQTNGDARISFGDELLAIARATNASTLTASSFINNFSIV